MDKCDKCGKGILRRKNVEYNLLWTSLGTFEALVCDGCGETIFDGNSFEIIEKEAKKKGLWGLSAKTRIGTAGNALDVRLPKQIAEFLKLKKGQEVVIEPLDKKRFQVIIE